MDNCLKAVSYTHLDVYKRQSKHIVKEINKDYLLDIPNKPFAINKVDSRGKINGKEYL